MRIRMTRRGAARAGVFVVLLILIVGGSLAYRYLFNRPGEQAIQLIPSDAFVVVTLDTTPSPAQTPVFNRIKKAMDQEGITKKVESGLTDAMEKSPVVAKVRPYTKSSFAFALFNQPGQKSGFDAKPVILMSISEPEKVQETLDKEGKKQTSDGMTVYKFASDQAYASVVGSYLAIAEKPADLARIDAVRKGSSPSVASLREYQEARAALPEDANLMVFLSPTAMKEINEESKKAGGVDPLKSTQWMAFSATVRDAGIAIDYRMPLDQSKSPALRRTAEIGALDFGVLKKLPSGAYGLMAMSQPGHYWDSVAQTVRENPQDAKGFDEGVADFEKQTGLSVEKDIVKGLEGHVWMAAYPDARGADRGVDGLILIDDANGADPAALADKVRGFVGKASSENGKQGVTFQSQQKNGATVWSLDEKSAKEMREGMADMTSSSTEMLGGGPPTLEDVETSPLRGQTGSDRIHLQTPGASVRGEAEHIDININAPGGLHSPNGHVISRRPQANPEAKRFAENKTVVYAQVGKAILIASSQEMLDKAVTVYMGQGASLAEDTSYSNMRNALPPGSQSAMMVDLGAIMRVLKPTIEKSMKGNEMGFTADDIVNLFGQNAGLVAGGKYDGKIATGVFFLPLEYERAIKGIGSMMRSLDQKGPQPGQMTWLRHAPEVAGALSGAPVRLAAR